MCDTFAVIRDNAPEPARSQPGPGTILLPALVLGGLGFALGFFGPILFLPESNQGPLLGIFFTGPLGFALGLAIGSVRFHRARRRAHLRPRPPVIFP